MNDSYRDQSMGDFFSLIKISGVHENIPYSGLTTHIVEILVLSPGWFRITKFIFMRLWRCGVDYWFSMRLWRCWVDYWKLWRCWVGYWIFIKVMWCGFKPNILLIAVVVWKGENSDYGGESLNGLVTEKDWLLCK